MSFTAVSNWWIIAERAFAILRIEFLLVQMFLFWNVFMNLGKTLYTIRSLCVVQSFYRAYLQKGIRSTHQVAVNYSSHKNWTISCGCLDVTRPIESFLGFSLHVKSCLHYYPQVRQYYCLSFIEIQSKWRDKQSFVSSEQGCYTWRQRYRKLCGWSGINPSDFCWWDTFWCTF